MRCLDNWWLMRRVMTPDYLLKLDLEVSQRLVALEAGYDSWFLTRDCYLGVTTTGDS